MQHSTLFAPVVTLALWTFVMWAWLYATRIPAIRKARIRLDPDQTKEAFNAQIPPQARWKAGNYKHLLEQPTDSELLRIPRASKFRDATQEPTLEGHLQNMKSQADLTEQIYDRLTAVLNEYADEPDKKALYNAILEALGMLTAIAIAKGNSSAMEEAFEEWKAKTPGLFPVKPFLTKLIAAQFS